MSKQLSEMTEQERADLAKSNFEAFLASKPSRQQLKAFMTSRATAFMATNKALPRKHRREAAKLLGNRMAKKALRGELS